jgi:hypothetical protein
MKASMLADHDDEIRPMRSVAAPFRQSLGWRLFDAQAIVRRRILPAR